MNDWLKNNLFAVLGIVAVAGGFLLTVYVKSEIASQLEKAGIVPAHEVVAIKEDVQDNTDDIDTIENQWNAFIDEVAAQRIED